MQANLAGRCLRMCSSSVLATLVASGGLALVTGDSLAAADTSSDEHSQLEEIIVTAQKRVENLQQVPLSAQVIGSQTLAIQNQNTLQDLTQLVPSVHVDSGGLETNNFFIRGIGSGGNEAFDQSVSTFVDDVYHGRSRMSGATFLDLDRIEVLKGPQSTFFGNNAIAGALNIVTKKPGDEFDAWGRLLYGQFGQYAAEGAIGGPITDTFGARLAVTRNGSEGWIENVNTTEKAPRVNNEAARLTLLFKPTEDLEATSKTEASENRTAGTAGGLPLQWVNCPAAAPIGANAPGGYCAQALALGPSIPMGLDNDLNTGLPGQGASLSTFEEVLTVTYHKWDQTFTSVSGFYNYHFNENYDEANLPTFTGITEQVPEKYNQFSQEFRVASPAGQRIEYQAGAYFQTDQLNFLAQGNAPQLNGLTSAFEAPTPYLPLAVEQGFAEREHVYSIFGSLSWNVTDSLKLNTGLRGTKDNKSDLEIVDYGTSSQVYGGFVPLPPALEPLWAFFFGPAGNTLALSRSDQAWMPSAGIQYQIDPDTMGYFTYNKGFKAGGILPANTTVGAQNEYGPERVNAYELGLKSKWFDNRLLLNLDVFRGDYQDLQVSTLIYNPVANFYQQGVGNAAESRSQGVELEAQWVVAHDFRLGANVTYLDSYYVSYAVAPDTTLAKFNGAASSDLTGQATQYAPRWSGSVSASYGVALPGNYKLTSQLNPYFTSSYLTQSGDPFFLVHSYVRLDGQLTLAKPDSRWAIDVIGKNLTDRIIVAVPGVYNAAKEQPRNIAVQFRYHFGAQ
jgi:iron complex outermembrane receptor protein